MNPLTEPSGIIFLLSSLLTVAAAALVVWHRSIVYSAFFLSMVGVGNSILFTLLGFPVIALFHLAVYVGAAVTFILFSVIMFKEAPVVEPPFRALSLVAALSIALILINIFSVVRAEPSFFLKLRDLTSLLVGKYWFALIVAAITLVTTLIEAITLARREEVE